MTTVSDDVAPTRAEMLDRAKALASAFRERAEGAEEARVLPQVSIDEMVEADLCRVLAPKRFGGYELGLETWLDMGLEIARGDASHGWCANIVMHHSHYVAQFPEEAQEAVWADGPDAVVAGSVLPVCEVTAVDGGFRLSGRSPFTSGIAGSSWVILGGFLPEPGPPQWAWFLVPPGEYEVLDTWFTSGMRGTGSNTVVTEDVFVPGSRMMRQSDLRDGRTEGGRTNPADYFRAPWYSYAPITFVGTMLGATQGAYEDFRSWTAGRKAVGGRAVAEFAAVQTQTGRVAATLDAAELLLRRAAQVASVEPVSDRDRYRTIRDFARVSELVVESMDTLMKMSGTAGFAASNPIQRAWRDVHFASSHISLNPDTNLSNWGREEFGLEPPEHQVF
jgi:3-hydroxy-9,10-secoandrosta-1,3,5(10)-triene-9,17-dione monooxygenase